MEEIEDDWQTYIDDFTNKEKSNYYCFDRAADPQKTADASDIGKSLTRRIKENILDHWPYRLLSFAHNIFFDKTNSLAHIHRKFAGFLESHNKTWILKRLLEDPMKITMLSCQGCGDCGIQHAAFLCPESQCPKHTRNGPCGGSRNGFCEVHQEKYCVWVRAYTRLKKVDKLNTFLKDKVPPRNWELNKTSSWVNFHLNRDHQS